MIDQSYICPSPPHHSKIQVITDNPQYIIVEKPNNISSETILNKLPRTLLHSLEQKLKLIYMLPSNIGGLLVIAKNKTVATNLRNEYGSYHFQLIFDIISQPSTISKKNSIICQLPIAKHRAKEIFLISSTTGKKSYTKFTFLKKIGKFEHWQARCSYLRNDQIQLHAYESGIHILGDEKYAHCSIPSFKKLKHNFKNNRKENNEFPYHGPAIYLSALKLPDEQIIQINLSKKLSVFMKLLAHS